MSVGPAAPDDPDADEPAEAPLGRRLGPLPVWAGTAVVAASVGHALGARATGTVRDVAARIGSSGGTVAAAAGVVLAVAALTAIAVAVDTHVVGRRAGVVRGIVGALLVAVVLAGGAAGRAATAELGALPQLADRGGPAEVTARVAAEPRRTAVGWHVPVVVHQVAGATTRERAAVTVAEQRLAQPPFDGQVPVLGSRWRLQVTAAPLPDGGYGRWLAQQHLAVRLDARAGERLAGVGVLAAGSEQVRDRARRAAIRHPDDAVGALQVGMVTGDTRGLPDGSLAALTATSLTHLVAVSGTHTAIVVGGALVLLGVLRLPARARWVGAALVLAVFAYLTRFQPSVLRAGVMGGVLLLTAWRGHLRDVAHALAGAVLLLVLLDPALATSVGLRLSAGATVGVLLLAPRIARRCTRLPRRLADAVGIAVGAQLAVLPLLLTTFGDVPLVGVPANVLAVPLAVLAIAVAVPAALVAAVHPAAGAALFAIGRPPAAGVLGVAETLAGRGGVATLTAPITVVATGAVGAWLLTSPGRRAARPTAALAAVAVVVALGGPLVARVVPTDTFTVTAIDVGQGDAFLLRTPQARVLVDAGQDATASRWLARHGHQRLELAIATHGHLDHIGGLPTVLDDLDVGAVWRPPSPEPIAAIDAVDRAAVAAAVPVRELVAPAAAQVGDLHLEVLSPPPGRPFRHGGSEINEGSLVVRATWQDRVALVTGDAEEAAQRALLAAADAAVDAGRPDPLAAGLLTVPHHGSATTDPAFLARVAAPVGLISAGLDNRHGHPHDETLAALAGVGTTVHRTDLEGTVTVEVPASGERPIPPERLATAAEHGPYVLAEQEAVERWARFASWRRERRVGRSVVVAVAARRRLRRRGRWRPRRPRRDAGTAPGGRREGTRAAMPFGAGPGDQASPPPRRPSPHRRGQDAMRSSP